MKNKNILTPFLVNTEEMNRQNPDTFYLPENRASLVVGNYAKVSCNGERFWVKITEVDHGIYTGAVANRLVIPANTCMAFGSLIRFAPCNVHEAVDGEAGLDDMDTNWGFLPKGEYWICDPCYAWPTKANKKFLKPIWQQAKEGLPAVIKVEDGEIFMSFVSGGDGVYPVFNMNEDDMPNKGSVFVESGVMSVIPASLVRKWGTEKQLKEIEKEGGSVCLNMEEDSELVHEDGNVFFGHYMIANTLPDEDEDSEAT